MIPHLAIDLKAAGYRRALHHILSAAGGQEWRQIRRRGLLFFNWQRKHEVSDSNPASTRVHYFGLESDTEIQQFLSSEKTADQREVIFFATLRRDNLYHFSSSILDRAKVVFVLGFVPESLEERHQLFNLFHKSLMMRQVSSFLYYYARVVDFLTSTAPLPAEPPGLVQSLGPKSVLYQVAVLRDRVCLKFDLWYRHSRRLASAHRQKKERRALNECRHAVITGWYGTETAGDKAILKEVIHVLQERAPGIRISITSIVPGLSRLTNLEFQLDAEVLELRSLNYRQLGSVDLVVFGGGPLMDSSQLKYIETLFAWARSRNVATMVFGCGVGPLKTELGTDRVKSILRNTDHAFFRDERSADLAQQMGFVGPKLYACDPAMRYVARWRERQVTKRTEESQEQLVMLLRAQTSEYSTSAADESAHLREEVIDLTQSYLKEKSEREVVMLPMHTFWFGNDDRDFSKEIVSRLPADIGLRAFEAPLQLDRLLEKLAGAAWALPMRFHGHIFMLALDIPFVSIDYTGTNGKVANLVERYGLSEFTVQTTDGIGPGDLKRRWASLEENSQGIRAKTYTQVTRDLRRLEEIYDLVFGAMPGQEAA